MEPIGVRFPSIGVAATATAIRAAQRERLRKGRLPKVLKAGRAGGKPIAVLAVHVRRVEMLPEYEDGNFTIQVKHGAKSSCLRCRTESFSPEIPITASSSHRVQRRLVATASAKLDSLCLFHSFEPVMPVVRFAVGRKGLGGLRTCTIAKASASIEHLSGRRVVELPLHGDFEEDIGRVIVAFEVLEVRPQDLARSLELAGAQQQQDAYLMTGAVPTVPGSVVDDGAATPAAAAAAAV